MTIPTDEFFSISFGNWLKSHRRRLDWTQEKLASAVFCSVSTIRKIEAGDLTPSRILAEQLAQTLTIPAQQQAAFLNFARGLSADFLTVPLTDTGSAAAQNVAAPPPVAAPLFRPPTPLNPLIGREREMQSGTLLLRRVDVRLVTLVGPPGAGKTRLSLALGAALQADFAHGVCFVPLAPIVDPALVLSAIAQALHLYEVTGATLSHTLHDFLRQKELLLILDNFEQVVDAAPVVSDLLSAASGVKALASSREALHIYGEHEFPVSPLAVPDVNHLPTPDLLGMYPAVDLFIQRAQAVNPSFVINAQNAAPVAHICAWLDGLPLAIEMAAAHVKWKPPATLLEQLRQQLMGLTGGQRDLSPRQQTLRGAIDWSYKLLSEAEQQLLMALSVVNGGCSLAVAAELSGNELRSCEALLRGLAEKSLLQWTTDSMGEPRVALLQMIREYAQMKSTERGNYHQLRAQHAAIYHRLVQESQPFVRSPEAERVLNRLEMEHNNLRSALAWHLESSSVRGVKFATLLADTLWGIRGYFSEGRNWLEKMVDAAANQSTDGTVEAFGWIATAHMALGQGDLPAANRIAARAEAFAFANENDAEVRMALHCRAGIALHQSDYVQARRLYQQALALCGSGDENEAAIAFNGLGLVAKDQGDLGASLDYHERAYALYASIGDSVGMARALTYASIAAYWQAEYQRCFDLAQQAIELQRGIGDVTSIAYSRDVQGMALVRSGRYDEGIAILDECVTAFQKIGDVSGSAMILVDLGLAHYMKQNWAQAYRYHQESLNIARSIGDRRREAFCLEGIAMTLTRMAVAETERDETALSQAVALFARADGVRRQIDSPLPASERAEYDICRAIADRYLSAELHKSAWEEGVSTVESESNPFRRCSA